MTVANLARTADGDVRRRFGACCHPRDRRSDERVARVSAFAKTPNEGFGIITGDFAGTYGFYGLGVELRGMSGVLDHLGLSEQPTAPRSLQFVETG